MATVADLLVRIRGDNASLLAALRSSTAGLDRLVTKTTIVGAAIAAATATAALAGASVKASLDFETAFTGVEKTVNASRAELDELRATIRAMSREIPVTAVELARIGQIAGQLGVQGTDNIARFIDTVARIGVATDLSTEEAAVGFARLSNIMGFPIERVDQLASAVVALGNNVAANEGEILDFALRISGAGRLVGLTEGQVLSLSAVLPELGIQAEAGGTAVQRALLKINEAVAAGGDDLALLAKVSGQTVAEFTQQWGTDAFGAFTNFVAGLNTTGADASLILDELGIGGQRGARTMLALAQNADLLADRLAIANPEFQNAVALTNESARAFSTGASQIQVFKNRITDAMITAGDAIKVQLLAALAGLNAWFDANGPKLIAFWKAIQPTVVDFGRSVQNTARVVVFLGSKIAQVVEFGINAWNSLPEPVRAVAKAIAAVATPIGQVALAFKLLGGGWRNVANGMIGVAETMINAVLEALNALTDKIGDILEGIRKVPFLGDKLGIPEGQIFEGGFGPVTLGRIAQPGGPQIARGAGLTDEEVGALAESISPAVTPPPSISDSWDGFAAGAGGAADAAKSLAERMDEAGQLAIDRQKALVANRLDEAARDAAESLRKLREEAEAEASRRAAVARSAAQNQFGKGGTFGTSALGLSASVEGFGIGGRFTDLAQFERSVLEQGFANGLTQSQIDDLIAQGRSQAEAEMAAEQRVADVQSRREQARGLTDAELLAAVSGQSVSVELSSDLQLAGNP